MRKSRLLSLVICGALVLGLSSCGKKEEPKPTVNPNANVPELPKCVSDDEFDVSKPVIYMYPEKETKVKVNLELNGGELTCTYPKYDGSWEVIAEPNGTLFTEDGKEYNYLYWEGTYSGENELSEGYCIKGEDTTEFLEVKLEELGLSRKEANEFIVYWLPRMESNKYNIISFDTKEYEKYAELSIEPKPDNLIRVFMQFYGSDEFVDLKEPTVNETPDRNGFTVVEWGGSELKR